jgi:tetratricopeptide (TPR) repeat protein
VSNAIPRPLCVLLLASAALATASASSAQSASHQHYAKSAEADRPSPTGALAPRLQNLGSHVFPVSTANPQARLFINQGLNLSYAFNHAESGRSFREAARLDPSCAMAYWGQALVLGPNINAAMDPNEEPAAYGLIQKATALKARATAREQAYIDALATRYSGMPADRAERDRAYARAMGEVVKRFPDDLDAAALYAESVMDLRPWGYWQPDGTPYPGTAEIVRLVEDVIRRNPQHPGALHLYIHLMEPTRNAARAEQAADRLLTLMPAAGHLVHMPGHIYQRIGRYADAVRANELAILADEDYITQCRAQGLYPMGYYPHNIHFLWWAATMDGRGALAVDAARKVAAKVPDEMLAKMPMLAGFKIIPYYALTRFGRWDEMLREPAPPAENPFYEGIWHYARGLAFLGKGQALDAEAELVAVRKQLGDKRLDAPLFSPNTMRDVLAIAPEVLAGELSAARKEYGAAISHLERAVRLEDGLVYTEPAEWHYPTRHALGAVLLEADRPAEAETVYWDDLNRNPENGWALTGLLQALKAQGKTDAAAAIAARLAKSWARADVRTAASRISAAASPGAATPAPARDTTAPPFAALRPIGTPAADGSLAPQLTASAAGGVYLSWLEPDGATGFRFRIAERRGDTWISRTDIASGAGLFANWADVPSVFAAGNGRIAAHWLEKSAAGGEAYGIRVRTSSDGGASWSDTFTPHRDQSLTEHGFLSFFDAPDAAIGMVWLDGRQTAPGVGHGHGGGATMLRATTLGSAGTLGDDALVDDRVCDCCPTTAVRTARGALVAYRDRSAAEVRDISLARLENGAWKPGGTVHADGWTIPGCPVNGPALASSGDLVAVAWFTAAGDQGRTQVAFSRDGGATFGAPVRADDGVPLGRVDLELLPDGSAIVVWIESSTGHGEVRARRVFADGRRGASAVIAAVGSDRSSGYPRVVRSGDELIFTWRTAAPPTIAVAVAAMPPDARR